MKKLLSKSNGKYLAAGLLTGALWGYRLLKRGRRFQFQDKTVLITGGSRGLGLVLARELAARGAKIALCARDEAELAAAKEDLRARFAPKSISVEAYSCDVTDPAEVQALVQAVQSRFHGIDVLINNAGIIQVGPMEHMTLSDYERAMETHFYAPLYTTLAVLPEYRLRQRGRIVNITSIGGKISVPHLLPYSASKFALVGFSEGLRAELAQFGIVVTTVCPGLMRTGSHLHAKFKGKHQEEFKWFAVSDALPFFSLSAEKAAQKIADACERGSSEIILSLPAKLAVLAHGVFPSLVTKVLSLVNRALPSAGGIGTLEVPGFESQGKEVSRKVLAPIEEAATRNNERVRIRKSAA